MQYKYLVQDGEIAKILNVPVSWVYQHTRLGQQAIPHIRMGKYVRFNPEEVINFFKAKQTRDDL